jgi:hypothetical protein
MIDLGLRLADVERLDLQSEPVEITKKPESLRDRLEINGATEDEIEFLLDGQRVELNAMPSDVFVQFIEDGLQAHGVEKFVPDDETLKRAYATFKREQIIRARLDAEIADLQATPIETPDDLSERLTAVLADNGHLPWDEALRGLVDEDGGDDAEARVAA